MQRAPHIDNIDQVNVDRINPDLINLPESELALADDGLLNAVEAAARLGVKRQTLYAYVSRGMLARTVAIDGRTSLFDQRDIDELRLGRGDRDEGELRAVIATSISRVDDEALLLRGHDLVGLVEQGTTFAEIVDRLWQAPEEETWPTPDATLTTRIDGIDGLRTLLAAASAADPMRHDLSPPSVRAAGRRIIVAMVHGLPAGRAGGSNRATAREGDLSRALWSRLSSHAGRSQRRAVLDAALCLLVDHGLASSTFAARIAASVRADPYSVVIAGLGALGGPLHGAASGSVHRMIEEAARRDDPASTIGDLLRAHDRVPGFGHTIYERHDPRYGALMSLLGGAWADDQRLGHVHRLRDIVAERSGAMPNVDLALGAFTWLATMAPEAGETIFAVARSAGWLAHATEEYDEMPLRFSPRARYVGPTQR